MDFISGERLFHILMPWSNIDFLENCGLNKGVLIERLLQVSYVWYCCLHMVSVFIILSYMYPHFLWFKGYCCLHMVSVFIIVSYMYPHFLWVEGYCCLHKVSVFIIVSYMYPHFLWVKGYCCLHMVSVYHYIYYISLSVIILYIMFRIT